MSKGSKIVPVRIEPILLAQINCAVASRNANTKEEPDTIGGWIRRACKEKLAHLARTPKNRKKKMITCLKCGRKWPGDMVPEDSRTNKGFFMRQCILCLSD